MVAKLLDAEFNGVIEKFVEQLVAKGPYNSEELTNDVSKITEVIRQIKPNILARGSDSEEQIVRTAFKNFLQQIEAHLLAFVNKVKVLSV